MHSAIWHKQEVVNLLNFALNADYTFVCFFTTNPLPRVLIFNQICIGDFEPSLMGQDNLTDTSFKFNKPKMQIGHFIPILGKIGNS